MRARFLLAIAVFLAPAAALAGQSAAPGRIAEAGASTPPALTPPAPAAEQAGAADAQAAAAAPEARPAAPAVAAPAPVVPLAAASAGNLLQTIFALCLVLGLLAALAWFLKRYGPKTAAGPAKLRIVGALNLGGRERIMVVEVGDQWIVVGASPGRVNALATLPRQESVGGDAVPNQLPLAASFSDWLKQTIDKRNAR